MISEIFVYGIWPLLATFILLGSAHAIGSRIWNLGSDIEHFLYSIGVGFGAIGIFAWLVGWIGLFYTPILFLAYVPAMFPNFKRIQTSLTYYTLYPGACTILALYLFWCLLQSELPAAGGDPVSTLLYASKYYLKQHQISLHPWFAVQQLHEMLAAVQMSLVSDPSATLSSVFCVLSGAMVYVIGCRHSRTAGIIGMILYVTLPISRLVGFFAMNEHVMVFYFLLMFNAVEHWQKKENLKWLYWGAVLGSLSACTDRNGIIPCLICFILTWKCGKKESSYYGPGRFLGIVILFAAIFYLPPFIKFGNPLFPFYEEWFSWIPWGKSSVASGPFFLKDHSVSITPGSPHENLFGILLYLTPVVFFIKRKGILLAYFVCLSMLYWGFYEHSFHARFMIITLAVHCAVLGMGISDLITRIELRPRRILMVIFVVIMVHASNAVVHSGVAFTKMDQSIYLEGAKPGIYPLILLNRVEDCDTAYLLDLEGYRYYCDFDVVGHEWGPDAYRIFSSLDPGEEQRDWLLDRGCDYLVVNYTYSEATDLELPSRYFSMMEPYNVVRIFKVLED